MEKGKSELTGKAIPVMPQPIAQKTAPCREEISCEFCIKNETGKKREDIPLNSSNKSL